MNSRGDGIGAFGILFILFLIIAISIVGYLYLSKPGNRIFQLFDSDNDEDEVVVIPEYKLTINTNAERPIRFIIRRGSVVGDGIIRPGIKETYNSALYNNTYKIELFGNGYYSATNEMLITSDTEVDILVDSMANITTDFTNGVLSVFPNDGIIQQPLICMSWIYHIYVIEISGLQKTNIPERLKPYVDVCYAVNGNIDTNTTYNIDIRRIENRITDVKFFIIDKEVNDVSVLTYDVDTGIPDYINEVKI